MNPLAAQGEPPDPVWAKTLSPEQRQGFATWVVEKLSKAMHREELLAVLTLARKQAKGLAVKYTTPPKGARVHRAPPKRWRGRPSMWPYHKQMVAEVEARMSYTGALEAEIVEELVRGPWRDRFPDKTLTEIRRAYRDARKLDAEREIDRDE
jgi:hypothetical protein